MSMPGAHLTSPSRPTPREAGAGLHQPAGLTFCNRGVVTWLWATQVAQCRRIRLLSRRCKFDPWVGKILWRKKWQPTPVFLPAKFHGQRSLAGYSPWGNKESDTTERLNMLVGWAYRVQYVYFLPKALSVCSEIYPSSHVTWCVLVVQLCLSLCGLMDCSLPGSSVRGLLQAKILEWVAMAFSGGSF